ncbi:MAG TPA: aldehyde dehydrogenase family protein [Jatrophihabitans sp.]|nr:aldehyde dehydrogenase family protein [Jatrophihabitans sp.]
MSTHAQVQRLAELVTERAPGLLAAALASLPFPHRVLRGDIELAARRLAAFDQLLPALAGRQPLGTVAITLPGNAILSNPVTAVASAVLAGNRARLRFPQRRKQWADALAELFSDAFGPAIEPIDQPGPGFLDDSFADPDVAALVVFGSDDWMLGYQELARSTGTKVVFEGPGKDPFLVLPGANVQAAAAAAAVSGTYNAGQACTAPERIYVAEPIHDEFVDALVATVEKLPAGDIADPRTWLGPLTETGAAQVRGQLEQAVTLGAEVVAGGRFEGTLLAPTVVVGADHRMDLMRLETFGPVLPVAAIDSVEQALTLAEDSPYGLSATVFGGPGWLPDRLARSHGDVHRDESWLDRRWRLPLARYGGRRRSGWVWEWQSDQFVRRDGPRSSVRELSKPLIDD